MTGWPHLAPRTTGAAIAVYAAFFSVTAFQLFNLTSWLGSRGIDGATAGRMQGTADLFFVAGVLTAGLLADWLGGGGGGGGFRRPLFLSFFALAALGYALLGISDLVLVLTCGLCLIGFGFMPLTNLTDTHLQPYVSRNLMPYSRVRSAGSVSFTLVLMLLIFLTEAQILSFFTQQLSSALWHWAYL